MEINGPLIGTVSLFLSVAVIIWMPEKSSLQTKLTMVIAVFSILLIVTLFHAAWSAFSYKGGHLPAVRYVKAKDAAPNVYTLLLDPSELFSIDVIVSVYYAGKELEELIGIGNVVNVQTNKRVQVEVSALKPDTWQQIINAENRMYGELLVKVGASQALMESAKYE